MLPEQPPHVQNGLQTGLEEKMRGHGKEILGVCLGAVAILSTTSSALASEQAQFDLICKGELLLNGEHVQYFSTTAIVDLASHEICFGECSYTGPVAREHNIISFSDNGTSGTLDLLSNHLSISHEERGERKAYEADCSRRPFSGFPKKSAP